MSDVVKQLKDYQDSIEIMKTFAEIVKEEDVLNFIRGMKPRTL